MPRTVGSIISFIVRSTISAVMDRRGRIGAHAPVFGPGVAVADTFVILRGGERQHALAVAKAEEAGFLAVEIGLDDHLGAGRAEGAREAFVDCGKGLVEAHRHRHALAGASPSALMTIGAPSWRT